MIKSATLMTRAEVEEFIGVLATRNSQDKGKAMMLLTGMEEEVTAEYVRYEQEQIGKFYDQLKEFSAMQKAWDNKKCPTCGASLRLVNGNWGDFWSCPNYQDGNNHPTFPLNYSERHEERRQFLHVRIQANWLTNMIRNLKLPTYVKASDLLKFLEVNGWEDLRAKYNYRKTKETISGYVNAKMHSRKEEMEITGYLTEMFEKLTTQLGIRYTLEGEKEKVAILDAVASDSSTVFVFEIKRGVTDMKEEQLKLYYSLLQFILSKQQDNRMCKAAFLVYNQTPYDNYSWLKTKYVAFQGVKNIQDKKLLKQVLIQHSIA